ncbi:Ubp3 protein [Candida orthopsilosis Co 90-125]|uniref:Ubiquitin carboxyl-terminal hydrolase n=1 Tax=Candida orthopsilosis (strain 90-125) TaxID=1136231 RepID=H8X9I0_CANO9|nr:Ubp3 protein [Candida orthopsilosis Co 90-125]CCG24646.1 Ubp3 protein [Candida orthopsilosis Co 90-125]
MIPPAFTPQPPTLLQPHHQPPQIPIPVPPSNAHAHAHAHAQSHPQSHPHQPQSQSQHQAYPLSSIQSQPDTEASSSSGDHIKSETPANTTKTLSNPTLSPSSTPQQSQDINSSTNTSKENTKHTSEDEVIPQQNEPESKKQVVAAPTLNGHKETKKTETVEAQFPLYINETKQNFSNTFPITEENRELNDIDRLNNLNNNVSRENKVIICPIYTKVFDLNNSETYITNGKDIKEEEMNKGGLQAQSTVQPAQPPSTNWASILQSSAPQVPARKITKPKATTIKAGAAAVIPAIKSKPPTPDFDFSSESTHPLGILLLKVMFDSNYSLSNDFPVFDIKPKGLTNTGNICFMNSILQSLLYCKPFNKLLKLIETKSIGDLVISSQPLIDTTIKLFNEFKPSDNKLPVSIEPFYSALSKHKNFQHLKWGQQEDAEEFLGYYLDALNEEMIGALKKLNTPQVDQLIQSYTQDDVAKFKYNVKTCIKRIKKDEQEDEESEWNEVGSKKNITKIEVDPTPLNMIFGGEFKSVITIPKVSSTFQKSITLDPFQHVQLDISNSNSIEEAFIHLNELETISYKGNNNKEVEVKKQTFIEKLPQVLIIHLKRFSYSKDQENAIEKLAKNISYDHTLTIPNEILSQPQGVTSNQYQLISVVYHHGSSADAGHYTSDTFDFENNQWWEIDDTIVKPIKDDEVLSSGINNAYILLYSKI